MTALLLIDDDDGLATLLADFLGGQGYVMHRARDGLEGMRLLYAHRPDLVLLDIVMARRDGWDTLALVREVDDVPVIMLTARDQEAEILRGFALGADDYVTKPFSFAQLAARIKAVLARSERTADERDDYLRAGDLVVDTNSRRVWQGDRLVRLTPTEYKLLLTLMRRAGETVSREELVVAVWGEQYAEEVGYVRRYVWHLRRKIEPQPEEPRYIHNEHGFGYRFQVSD